MAKIVFKSLTSNQNVLFPVSLSEKDLFSAIVVLLHESGYVSLDVQYIDGTKIESASNCCFCLAGFRGKEQSPPGIKDTIPPPGSGQAY